MAKHGLAERVTPADVCEQLKHADGVDYVPVAGGEQIMVDLLRRPNLSPFVRSDDGRLWQHLRAVVTLPDPELPKYGLVEAVNNDVGLLMLVALAGEGEQPRVTRILNGRRTKAEGPTWQSSLQVSDNGRYLGIEHGGAGATEVIAATTTQFNQEHLIAPEVWAAPAEEVLAKAFRQ